MVSKSALCYALHDSGAGAKDGLIAKLKLVYADPPGSPPNLAATGADFFTDAKGDTKTTWEVRFNLIATSFF